VGSSHTRKNLQYKTNFCAWRCACVCVYNKEKTKWRELHVDGKRVPKFRHFRRMIRSSLYQIGNDAERRCGSPCLTYYISEFSCRGWKPKKFLNENSTSEGQNMSLRHSEFKVSLFSALTGSVSWAFPLGDQQQTRTSISHSRHIAYSGLHWRQLECQRLLLAWREVYWMVRSWSCGTWLRVLSCNMKNDVFWGVALCRPCENRHFERTCRINLQGRKIRERETELAVG
jgi:hypothetical protein